MLEERGSRCPRYQRQCQPYQKALEPHLWLWLAQSRPDLRVNSSSNITAAVLWNTQMKSTIRLEVKARSPVKFVDACDEKATYADGSLSRSMMIKAKNTLLNERIWINRVASELVFQDFVQTLALQCTMSVWVQIERNPICISPQLADVTDGMRSPGNFLLTCTHTDWPFFFFFADFLACPSHRVTIICHLKNRLPLGLALQ